MVDTLGVNARTLEEYIKGTEELIKGEREIDDLEPERIDTWTLAENTDLEVLIKDLDSKLDANRPENVRDTLLDLRDYHRKTVSLRNQRTELARTVTDIHALLDGVDPKGGKPKAKLTPRQSNQLRDLRKQYANVQTQLAQAEDAASLLRAKIVTQEARNTGLDGGEPREVPTVEAVINTIAKMTRMAEMKRGDVDLLEARLKKLKRASRGGSEDLAASVGRMSLGAGGRRSLVRFGSETPSPRKSVRSRATKSPSYVLSYSDEDEDANEDADGVVIKREDGDDGIDDELAAGTRALAIRQATPDASSRPGVSGLSEAELEDAMERRRDRRKVLEMFRAQVVQRGVKVRDVTAA